MSIKSHTPFFQMSGYPIFPPRVFGCICYVHYDSPNLDKLAARATKCVFLGYSRLRKGYKFYSSKSRKYSMFVDVTFLKRFISSLPPQKNLFPYNECYLFLLFNLLYTPKENQPNSLTNTPPAVVPSPLSIPNNNYK